MGIFTAKEARGKQCKSCAKIKPVSDFYSNNKSRDRLDYRCKKCVNARPRPNPARDKYNRRLRALRVYGLSAADFDRLYLAQGGVCAICLKKSKTTLNVDHCHKTGLVRGLLCSNCNTAIGLLDDDTERIDRAKEYLGGSWGDYLQTEKQDH